jgi:hypothetical protein
LSDVALAKSDASPFAQGFAGQVGEGGRISAELVSPQHVAGVAFLGGGPVKNVSFDVLFRTLISLGYEYKVVTRKVTTPEKLAA